MTSGAVVLQLDQRTWADASARWYRQGAGKAAFTRSEERRYLAMLSAWDPRPLVTIDEGAISDLIDQRLAAGQGGRSLNRLLEIVRAVLRAAVEWRWIPIAPTIRLLPRPPKRLRWLRRFEATLLLRELPPHLRAMAAFSLETGLRKRNVVELEWSQVDLASRMVWIHADQAKGKRSIPVPLTPSAAALIEAQAGRHPTRVFTYRGRPVRSVNRGAWRKALRRAGIRDFRWHDLRHTWASWHVQAGTPLPVLQQLGGWASYSMVLVYAHLSTEHLLPYVERFHGARQGAVCDR